jgi:hypothetical protein
VSADEGQYIRDKGDTLNRLIERKANRPHWRFVDGIGEAFRGHGYCSDENWLVQFENPFDSEGGFNGPVHPNPPGHQLIADKLVEAISSGTDARTPVDRAVVTFERVKVLDGAAEIESHPNPVGLVVGSTEHSGGVEGGGATFDPDGGLPLGEWVALPDDGFTFRVDLSEGDELVVSANTKPPESPLLHVQQRFGADDRWGRGRHTAEVTSHGAQFEVAYAVVVVPQCRARCDDPTRRYEDEPRSSDGGVPRAA